MTSKPKMKTNINIYSLIVHLILIQIYLNNGHNIDTDFPLVFKTTFRENFENYFGISVDMQKVENDINFIIGSPKSNSSLYNVRQSGTVFRCVLISNQTTNCDEIDLNFSAIDVSKLGHSAKFGRALARDDMFLGGTIASRPNSAEVAVCGHKWWQEFHVNQPQHQINPSGSCFVVNLSRRREPAIGIFPLTDSNLQFREKTYYYSHSMSGFSAAFTPSGEKLLLGAPGFFQWRGTFLETEPIVSSSHLLKEKFLFHKSNRFQSESYAGYSLTIGHFFARIQDSVAVGAPRDMNFRGKVYIHNMSKGFRREESILMFTSIDGTQLGEYFGATLLAVNVNNDDFSDLMIGAPFYSSKDSGDCGRVYVYLSNGNGFNGHKVLIGSASSGSRFGTSMASLGDINYDGYNDIAIGAPYEDGKGSVYIYLGSKTGLNEPFAQKISAKEHLNQINLKGFGISIASDKDVDNNFYNDILIGSYLSKNAVLLRSKPIVNIRAEIILNTSQINVKDQNCQYIDPNTRTRTFVACIQLKYCIQYNGKYVPSSLNLNVTLRMDSTRPENPRCFAKYKNQIKSEITKVVTISDYSTQSCSDELVIYLKNKTAIDDVFNPIEFSLNYSLIQLQSKQTFCPKCPIIANNEKTTNQLHFLTGCRIDEKCISKLHVFSKTLLNNILIQRNESILEGFHKNLTLITTVQNRGEPSYLTRILIKTKPKLNLLKQDIKCRIPKQSSINDTKLHSLECDVGNPLEVRSQQQVVIPFDISQLGSDVNEIEFSIELKTASEVTKDSLLNETFVLNIQRNANLLIYGNSIKSQEIYESEDKRKSDSIPFTGVFQVVKQNWSSIESVLIEMTFPSLFNKQPLIYRPYVEVSDRGVSVNCNQSISILPEPPNRHSHNSVVNQRNKRSVDQNEDQKSNRKVLNLECGSHIECQKFVCFLGPFPSGKQTAKFLINSELKIKSIESIFGLKYDEIKLNVKTKATILDTRITSKSQQISTNFVFKRMDLSSRVEDFHLWVIIGSFCVGFVILFVIVLILLKNGFFRRKTVQKEETNEEIVMKSQTDDIIESNSLLEFEGNNSNENDDKN